MRELSYGNSKKKLLKIYFAVFFSLVVLGTAMVFNIRIFKAASPDSSFLKLSFSLMKNIVIAAGAFLFAYTVELNAIKDKLKYGVLAVIPLLAMVFLFGTEVNGSKRWLNLGFFMLQPSEIAKLLVIFYLATVICNKDDRIKVLKEVFWPLSMVSFICLLIGIEDMGTSLIIFTISIMMLMIGGMNKKVVGIFILVGAILFSLLLFTSPYRMARIKAFMDPWADRQAKGYQQVESQIALGRGGIVGVGFGNSERKINYLPEASTDFIFAIIGEEFGFVGSVAVILLFTLMFIIGVYFAFTSGDRFNLLLISGFVFLLMLQAIINIAVVTSTLPNKGVPLPFISYGGSALLTYSMMVGFIMNAVLSDNAPRLRF